MSSITGSSTTESSTKQAPQEFDLIIVGTGSANSIIGPEFDNWSIAIVERGIFGGTCLNVGCIPSKMFVYAADVATTISHASTYGIDAQINGVDWPAIRDRVFGRIDPIAAGGFEYRVGEGCANVTVFLGEASFLDDKRLVVKTGQSGALGDIAASGGTAALGTAKDAVITAPRIVLGAGARPFVPSFTGLADVPFDTSDTVMRLAELPERMTVLGGGYIACELGYVFAALGTKVTVVNRSNALLRAEDDDVSAVFTQVANQYFDLRLGKNVVQVSHEQDQFHVDITDAQSNTATASKADTDTERLTSDVLLVATGRVPNGDQLNLGAAGIAHDKGRVLTDEHFATNVKGVWACGDLSSIIQLKHLANAQVRALRHNLLVDAGSSHAGPDLELKTVNEAFVPHAVFSHPQIASVGLTERDARAAGHEVVVAKKAYGDTAYGWAMEDTTSFAKMIADRRTGKLLGAHIIGAQASILLQPLIGALELDLSIDQLARKQFYIHPALTEVVENCLLDLLTELAGGAGN